MEHVTKAEEQVKEAGAGETRDMEAVSYGISEDAFELQNLMRGFDPLFTQGHYIVDTMGAKNPLSDDLSSLLLVMETVIEKCSSIALKIEKDAHPVMASLRHKTTGSDPVQA